MPDPRQGSDPSGLVAVGADLEPGTVLAAYRIGDSPMNVITPLMVYFPVIVTFGQRYVKKFGVGSLVALMLPIAVAVLVVWLLLLVVWFLTGLPLGPGYPVRF